MGYLTKLNNIYVIDGKMWGFEHYMSAYIVEGKEIAMIDTGESNRLEDVKAGIRAHGFALKDISYLFITHGHQDHAGNAAPLLREMPKAKVYIHPLGKQRLTAPDTINWADRLSPETLARKKPIEPVPPERIHYLQDGEVFDIGGGEKLKIMFAPAHQPNGIVIFEEKNNGLFINDIVGNCFQDADCQYCLNPLDSDNFAGIQILEKLVKIPLAYLYLGHYGITDKSQTVMNRAIKNMHDLLDIGRKYVSEGRPDLIPAAVLKYLEPELQKFKKARGPELYHYAAEEHQPFQAKLFAEYCIEKFGKKDEARTVLKSNPGT